MLVLTTFGRQEMLNSFWTPDIFVAVPTLYFCYTREVPESNIDGASLDEPDIAAGYNRVGYPLDSTHWNPTGFSEVFNVNQIVFPALTDDWGMLFGMAIADSPTPGLGNVYAVGAMAEPFQPEVGDQPTIDPSDVTIGLFE